MDTHTNMARRFEGQQPWVSWFEDMKPPSLTETECTWIDTGEGEALGQEDQDLIDWNEVSLYLCVYVCECVHVFMYLLDILYFDEVCRVRMCWDQKDCGTKYMLCLCEHVCLLYT
jgi:hypothetical protein